ncbi:IS5 family transposase [Mucilaginibacter psychrotolerans]|uniref:IS5 family transposase n=2 Tax=Mucilaginibacter psychrotolerans TaxID=1524096 RepID=A0A4Y8RWY9_9SPHI|nr:IS5 family transposase [Mucilaginibacter psychrotolerans]TFF29699.1 IS5 family transposase [Mucilaginibacter psychrotolerans]
MKNYPTDLSDNQWQFIKKTLQLDDRRRKHDLRSIWNSIQYLLKTGCQWRMLPKDFAKWQLVYYYYKKWSDLEQFDLLLSKLRECVRVKMGQNAEASLGILDSQSVRWGNNKALNSFDGNKKVKGIKRHVIVDKNGFLIAVMVTVANIHDSKAVMLMMRVLKEMLCSINVIIADGGYRGEIIEQVKKSFGYLIQVVMRSDDKKTGFKPVHKRWVVERTFSWFDNDRRLCRNYELLLETSENMVKLGAIKLLLNKI